MPGNKYTGTSRTTRWRRRKRRINTYGPYQEDVRRVRNNSMRECLSRNVNDGSATTDYEVSDEDVTNTNRNDSESEACDTLHVLDFCVDTVSEAARHNEIKDNGDDIYEHGSDSDSESDGLIMHLLEEQPDDSEPETGSDGGGPDDPDDPNDSESEGDGHSSSESDQDNIEFTAGALDAPIHCYRRHTAKEVLLLTLALSLRHKWTYEALIASLRATNSILGRRILPQSKKQLWNVLNRNRTGIVAHAYCACGHYFGKKDTLPASNLCPQCMQETPTKKVKFFISLSLKKQLKHFLAIPGITRGMQLYREYRTKVTPDAVEDIYDGQEYKRLQQDGGPLASPYDFSYVFNTDGVRVGKSKMSVWPIYIRLNELPPNVRQKYMFLAGVWLDRTKNPQMNVMLRPFVAQANRLSSQGITWLPDGVNEVRSRFVPVCSCVDSDARWVMLNMVKWNKDHYGCSLCDHFGIRAARSTRYPILPHPDIPRPNQRTADTMIQDMLEALETGNIVHGIRGPSELMNLRHYGLAVGNASDDLHTVFHGAVTLHSNLLLTTVGPMPYAEKVRIIDTRLFRIRTPTCISRKPITSIHKRSQWKGSEWRNWLLHYSIVCLQGLVPERYINHMQLLSYAIFLFSQESISEADMLEASRCIQTYVQVFENYFGLEHMNYNIHLLTHIPECVRMWGPMWCYSTFNFESWNMRVVKYVTSPKGAVDQIVTRHVMLMYVNKALMDPDVSAPVRDRLVDILTSSQRSQALLVDNAYVLGKAVHRAPTEVEAALLRREGYGHCHRLTTYERVIKGSNEYRITEYHQDSKSDNSHIYTWDNTFCTIKSIVVFQQEGAGVICGMFVEEHDVHVTMLHAKHIASLRPNVPGLPHFIRVSTVRTHAIRVKADEQEFISPVPNTSEID